MSDNLHTMRLTVNGILCDVTVDPYETLVNLLRDRLGLTGTKVNCERGECGVCTVLMDGKAVNSCLVLAASADGHQIVTIEGLGANGQLDPLQQAFIDHDASHCGFCTPGMIMAAKGFLLEKPDPSMDEIQEYLVGNLCRCTGYRQIMRAVRDAAFSVSGEGVVAADVTHSCCKKESKEP